MRTKQTIISFLCAVFMMTGAQLVRAGERFGEAIDPKAPKITLAELLAKPADYSGKAVVMEGNFGGKCCEADFFFKDKTDMIEVTPPAGQEKAMSFKVGAPIRLYGNVNVRQESGTEEATVTVAAKGIEAR
jgi:uncharacterized protein YdeI (BOF family)